MEIRFPRVEGYRIELPDDRLRANFNDDAIAELVDLPKSGNGLTDLIEKTFGKTTAENVRVGCEIVRRLEPAELVLVGHSQGSGVLTRLIKEQIDGKPVQGKLISAILMGTSLPVPKGLCVLV